MARQLFGGSPSDYAMEKVGSQLLLRPAAVGTVWDALTGGTQLTDLTDLTGNPVTEVTADGDGAVAFYGPDGVTSVYIDFGYGRRYALAAVNTGAILAAFMGQGGAPGGWAQLDGSGMLSGAQVRSLDRFIVTSPLYGAVGDGTTDDTTAIQAAITAASAQGGGTVVLTAGRTFGLTDYLSVPSNVTISAYGATIKAISTHGLVRMYWPDDNFTAFNGHSNIRIEGGVWDANASDGVTGTVVGLVNAFTLGHNNNVTFQDVTVKNVSCAHGIDITASRNVRILNCRFLGFTDNTVDHSRDFSEAIQLDAALSTSGAVLAFDNTVTQDVLVHGCYFGSSERLGPFGRAVGSHTSVSGDYYDNIQVIGCRIEGARQEAIRPYAWRRAIIDGNVISGTGTSSVVITGPDPAVAGYNLTSHMVTVCNNIIEAPTINTPIRVVGFSAARPTGVRIHGNTIIGSPSTGIYVSQADRPDVTGNTVIGSASSSIYAISCVGPQIRNNTSVGAIGSAIGIDTCTGGGTMTGNSVEGAASGTGHGLFISNSPDVSVTANRVSAVRGSGIRATTTALRCRILSNTILRSGVTALGIDVTASATGGVVIGNDLSGSSWPASTGLSFAAGANPVTDWAGGVANPGLNLVS